MQVTKWFHSKIGNNTSINIPWISRLIHLNQHILCVLSSNMLNYPFKSTYYYGHTLISVPHKNQGKNLILMIKAYWKREYGKIGKVSVHNINEESMGINYITSQQTWMTKKQNMHSPNRTKLLFHFYSMLKTKDMHARRIFIRPLGK